MIYMPHPLKIGAQNRKKSTSGQLSLFHNVFYAKNPAALDYVFRFFTFEEG
jgi:hypothetical protein